MDTSNAIGENARGRAAALATISLLCLGVVAAYAAERVDLLDTWDDGSLGAWTNAPGPSVLSNEGNYLAGAFAALGMPEPEAVLAWTPVDPSVLVTNLSFRFMAEPRRPSDLVLCLHSRHGKMLWRKWLPEPEAGVWTSYSVPIDVAAGWSMGPVGGFERFRRDVLDIDWVGVFVTRSAATEAQSFGLDDFRIQGLRLTDIVDPEDDADGDGMPDAWEERNGLHAAWSGDRDLDSDGDGYTNYEEYRAGTDPRDPNAYLSVIVQPLRAEPCNVGVAVQWRSVRYRTYSVWKSTNLVEGFQLDRADIFCTPPMNTYVDAAATNAGPYFYRIQIE